MNTKINIELTGLNDMSIELTLEVAFSVYGEYREQTRDCPEEREEIEVHEVWVLNSGNKTRVDSKKSWEKMMEVRDNWELIENKCWETYADYQSEYRLGSELEVN